jgi:lincosamide nucleotidyltransferase A/C/D/E
VHVIELGDDGTVVPLCNVPWPFGEGSLAGVGTIYGNQVACVSAQTQLAMHQGYALPEPHERDREQLQRLV